jgi:hypothetical protein
VVPAFAWPARVVLRAGAFLRAGSFADVPAAGLRDVAFLVAGLADALELAVLFVVGPGVAAAAGVLVRLGGGLVATAQLDPPGSPSISGSAMARARALSAAARIMGPSISTGDASLLQPAGVPSWRSTPPEIGGASKRRCSAGRGARGLS